MASFMLLCCNIILIGFVVPGFTAQICFEKDLYLTNIFCSTSNKNGIPSGGLCCEHNHGDCTYLNAAAICEDGAWKILNNKHEGKNRVKRQSVEDVRTGIVVGGNLAGIAIMGTSVLFGPAAPFVAIGGFVVALISSIIGASIPPPNNPPKIACPASRAFDSEFGKLTKTIKWSMPKASDQEDGDISSKVKPRLSVKTYKEGRTTESFTVKDSKGEMNVCNVNIDVNVPRCHRNLKTGNGTYTSSSGDIYHGVNITYTCNPGYKIDGQSKLTCQSNSQYNFGLPKCVPIKCENSSEIKPLFGKAICDYSTLEYKTICQTDCSELHGYELKDDVGFAQCKSDKTWTRSLPSCQDTMSPVFDSCPSNIEVIAPALKTSATVSWSQPTASDNSGLQPAINQINGLVQNSDFDEGLTPISYIAIDAEGNESPTCLFDVLVTVRRCLPPSLKGKLLKYTPLPDYLLGSQVNVSCDGGFQIEGASTMTCAQEETDNGYTMFWDIGSGSYPYCKQINCSELPTPANGALVCDKWLFGTMCQIQCNIKYDIPLGPWTTGQYVCSMSSGKWKPTGFVPGCTEKKEPNSMVLPGEIFYFTGNCSDDKTQQLIKENFIKFMQDLQNTKFSGVCMNDDECSIENVQVRCGHDETNRKKRSLGLRSTDFKTVVTFNINVKLQSNNNNASQYEERKKLLRTVANEIEKEVQSGALDIEQIGLEVDTNSTSFGAPLVECGEGQMLKDGGLSCGSCPLGFQLNDTTSKCEECPMHFFRDDSNALCKKCPRGTITRTTGAVTEHECKAMCSPGSFSNDGIEPCNKCNPNTYQPSFKSTNCTTCPLGTTTFKAGANSSNNCSGFDLKVNGGDSLVSFGKVGDNITAFSVAFWIKLDKNENQAADIVLGDTGNQLTVNLTDVFHLTLHGEYVNTNVPIKNKKWMHLAITYDVVTTYVNMYISGTKVVTEKVSISLPVLNSTSGLFFENKNKGGKVILSNLIFSPFSIPDNGIRKLSSECSIDPTMLVIESLSNPMMWKRVNAELSMPSICDAFDDCTSSPCGKNSKCENAQSGYECICLNGFTGQHCNIPPDYCAKSQCQNGATCNNSLTGYTCDCEEGYKGNYCQIKIVNGQWSEWSGWSVCSVTCDGGSQQRKRYCDNPIPDPDGKICLGDEQENRTCSEQKCPECPEMPSVYGVLYECNKTEDMISCKVSCRTGLAFIPQEPPLDMYACGRNTDYKWNAVPPSCTEFHSPKVIKTRTSVEYPDLSCSEKDDAKRQIIENSQSLQCLANKSCDAEIQIEGCATPGGTLRASIELISTIADGDLDFEGFLNTSKPNGAMMSFLNSLNDLSLSANKLNTSEELYQLNIGGIYYDADMTSADTRVGVDCKEGHIQSALFCAECPQGTYYLDKKCEPCEYGMYQDNIASVKCKTCPEGYTTDYKGAKLKTECDVKLNQVIVKEEKISQASDSRVEVWVPIVASVLSFLTVVVVAVLIWNFVKKRSSINLKKRAHTEESECQKVRFLNSTNDTFTSEILTR